MELKDRVKKARNHKGLSQTELVERIKQLPGVDSFTQQALTKLETGDSRKSAFLPHIAKICGVDGYWLATGVGTMLAPEIEHQVNESPAKYSDESELEQEILEIFRELGDGEKTAVATMIRALAVNTLPNEQTPALDRFVHSVKSSSTRSKNVTKPARANR